MTDATLNPTSPREPLRAYAGFVKVGDYAQFLDKDVHKDMLDWSWMRAWIYGSTGMELSEAQVKFLESMMVYTAYPDVRLWNNRIAGLTANARAPASLGLAAGMAMAAAFIFGGQVGMQGIRFIRRALKARQAGESIEPLIAEDMRRYKRMAGYGRPFVSKDERIEPLLNRLAELGLKTGPHYALAMEVGELLQQRKAFLAPNFSAAVTAIVADMGITEETYSVFLSQLLSLGMPACYREWRDAPEGSLMSTAVEQVQYVGPPARDLP
jgi:hypothetical protein